MARKRSSEFELYDDDGHVVASSSPALPGDEQNPAPAGPGGFTPPHVATAGRGRYRVSLRCPTPLAHATLEIEDAANEDDARKQFCDKNGISDSSHEWDIQRIA